MLRHIRGYIFKERKSGFKFPDFRAHIMLDFLSLTFKSILNILKFKRNFTGLVGCITCSFFQFINITSAFIETSIYRMNMSPLSHIYE